MLIRIPNYMIKSSGMKFHYCRWSKDAFLPKSKSNAFAKHTCYDYDFCSIKNDVIIMGLYPYVYSFKITDKQALSLCVENFCVDYAYLTVEQLIEVANRSFLDEKHQIIME